MKKTNVLILFGENEVRQYENTNKLDGLIENISKFKFDTENEKKSFLLGLRTGIGWQEFIIIEELLNVF
ncbi:hypothetical protein [Flavobacterium restrictum]|uniref:Uncharacterized protein n=1 Tax=Flavobacterium restrictum TaxID=2594428 RepID=A0A553DTY9_9FLAO|nr:hypothetical protein [Flavobacterium restrictum]TRX36238.1 hypothetical protein FNW21_13815 [Flavobacterium restrictum]